MAFDKAITKERKLSCSLEFFAEERIFTKTEIKTINEILDGSCILVNNVPDFDIGIEDSILE